MDQPLSPALASHLRDAGHDAVHVVEYGLAQAEDPVIFDRAAAEDRVLVSADTDFGTILALRRERRPSVILFRTATQRRAIQQAGLLMANLPALTDALDRGCVAVLQDARIRVRRLPIGRDEEG